MEPRAAIARIRLRQRSLTLWNTSQNPHVARLVISAFRRHGARKQAARDRARCWRRLRIEDLHLSRRGRLPVGGAQGRPTGEVDADRSEAFLTDAHGRDHVTHAELAFDSDARSPACVPIPSPTSAPTCRPSRPSVPTYLYATLLSGKTTFRPSIARWMRSIPTPCRSMPIAARGVRKQRSSSSGWSRLRARELGVDPADLRKKQLRRRRSRIRRRWPRL